MNKFHKRQLQLCYENHQRPILRKVHVRWIPVNVYISIIQDPESLNRDFSNNFSNVSLPLNFEREEDRTKWNLMRSDKRSVEIYRKRFVENCDTILFYY